MNDLIKLHDNLKSLSLKNSLHVTFAVIRIAKNAKFGQNKTLSLHQIYFLILCYSLNQSIVKNAYFAKYGFQGEHSYYYLLTLSRAGYLDKIAPSTWKYNTKSLSLISDFQTELTRRLSQPLSWL